MLTPQRIQDLADPIESVYISMVNELMVNIGKHITKPTWTHTAAWEIQKLSELGQLTAENAAIINKWIKAMPAEIRDTMEETRREALEQIEKQLDKAAKKGYVTPPERDSTIDVLQEYSQQAADKLNLVNTTMLQSSIEQYQRLVILTEDEYKALVARQEATQTILNEAAGNVATGVETRKTALQRAIRRVADEGLTGFYDKAGRSWSPEAYVNMDIRTTVHNVAIQSVKNRMADYNTSVFQVSAHAGARPLCYPYQGKFYSWDNTEGDIETGNGSTVHYKPLNSTTYGQPAGLFGINCGHSPIPIIPGVTIPHAQDFVQPKEENDKAYAESQEQRALERQIRAAKRAVEMGDDSKEAKDRVKEAQAAMREFIGRTGRTRRYDRESLYGAKKADTTPEEKRPKQGSKTERSTLPTPTMKNLPGFTPAASIKEAEEFASKYVDTRTNIGAIGVSFDGVDVNVANAINRTLWNFFNEFDVPKFGGIAAPKANTKLGKMVQGATAGYMPIRNSFLLNRKTMRTEKDAEKAFQAEKSILADILANPDKYDLSKISKAARATILAAKISGRATVPENVEEALWHELGHALEKQVKRSSNFDDIKVNMARFSEKVSGYATTDISEYIAESFASWKKGEQLADPLLIDAFVSLRRQNNE